MARLTVRVGPLDGAALRKARTDSDRLIREVAEEAGISKAFLNTLELNYSRYMSRPKFNRLVEALGVEDPDSLLATPHEPEGETTPPSDVDVRVRHDERPARAQDMPELRKVEAVEQEAS